MKTLIVVFVILLMIGSVGLGQSKTSTSAELENQIISLDKSGWEAWKNNDPGWFQVNTTEDFLSINSDGVSNKEQVVRSTLADCKVTSVSLADFKFVLLDKNVVLLTYVANQDGTCGGKRLSPKVRVSVNYVRRQGKWLEALYMETPISEAD
jgi:hypothetical protein